MKTGWNESEKQLNTYQLEAVRDDSPACVVNANVGSGKTTVLIEKILYLYFEKRIPLDEMVVLTFTNKAADEIIERLLKKESNVSKEQVQYFGTFHSVALHLLKEKLPIETLGWSKDFAVMDPDEETDLALELIAEHKLNVKYKNRLKKRLEQEYNGYLQGKENSRQRDDLFLLYPLLEEEKKRQNKMSFSDLLRLSSLLLRAGDFYPKWIIVDEVQDSDEQQLELLSALKGEETKLFAVGDPNQVIYSWRGTVQNTFYVLKHRFEAKELSLPINYRSNATILEAANRFVQFGNKIQGARDGANKIVVKKHYDPFQEAEYLAERIRVLHEQGQPYSEIAVFYRLQKQSEILEKIFTRNQIPYEVSVRKTIKDIPVLDWFMKVLRYYCNPADVQMGIQALTDARYGSKCTKKKAGEMLSSVKQPEWQGMTIPSKEEIFASFGLREALHPTASTYAEDERLILEFIERLRNYCVEENCSFAEGTKKFVNSSALYGMDLFAKETDEKRDCVQLMTLHASKGLEFDTVFLIGVNQGLIPLHSQGFELEEEESRLFFVGITRARNELELSYYINPGEPRVMGECSRYLRRIPEQLLEWEDNPNEEQRRNNLQQLRKAVQEQLREKEQTAEPLDKQAPEKEPETIQESAPSALKKAKHPKYGVGVLVAEDEMMVEVEFEGYGRKQFLKAFGEVEIVE